VSVGVSAVVIRFSQCRFKGNLNGDLVYSNGQNLDFDKCTWQVDSANTWSVNFDCYNQNSGINDCRFGGIGKGIRITNALTPGSNRVEGARITNNYFVNTGTHNIEVRNSLLTLIHNNVLDQATATNVYLMDGATAWSITNNWIGGRTPFSGICVYINETAGDGGIISNNHIQYNTYGVIVNATASERVGDVLIANNMFANITGNPLLLDSVLNCTVTGNSDRGTPATGSWNTKNTFGNGVYTFDNNRWHTVAPALFHSGSTYKWGDDTGIVGKAKGVTTALISTTALVVSHGLFKAAAHVLVTPQYTTSTGSWRTNTYAATTFTINWDTITPSGACVWHWEATV
jgi:hypothetical protein